MTKRGRATIRRGIQRGRGGRCARGRGRPKAGILTLRRRGPNLSNEIWALVDPVVDQDWCRNTSWAKYEHLNSSICDQDIWTRTKANLEYFYKSKHMLSLDHINTGDPGLWDILKENTCISFHRGLKTAVTRRKGPNFTAEQDRTIKNMVLANNAMSLITCHHWTPCHLQIKCLYLGKTAAIMWRFGLFSLAGMLHITWSFCTVY